LLRAIKRGKDVGNSCYAEYLVYFLKIVFS
jgi:hypothetical protein